MADKHKRRLDRKFRHFERKLPDGLGRALRRLREPAMIWIRIPVGLALILGGIFSFLPVLGLWMLPLGLLLLAQDVPMVRRPVGRGLVRLERCWFRWKPGR